MLGYRLLRPKQLDPEFFNKFKSFAPFFPKDASPMIFDVGAHVGETVLEYKSNWPNCEIHSFEPQEADFRKLESTAARFQNAHCNCVALGSAPGHGKLVRNAGNTATSSFYPVNQNSTAVVGKVHPKARFECRENYSEVEVAIDTVDRYVTERHIGRIDIMKIDVQGFEVEVLRGAKNTLLIVGFILVEIMLDDVYARTSSFYDVEAEIRDFGFVLYDIAHIYKDLKRGRTHWLEAIYINRSIHPL